MKIKLPSFLDFGFRVIVIFLIMFLSFEGDLFAFGMMNVQHSIKFGLGVSLFLANNILAFFLIYELAISTFNKHTKKNSKWKPSYYLFSFWFPHLLHLLRKAKYDTWEPTLFQWVFEPMKIQQSRLGYLTVRNVIF